MLSSLTSFLVFSSSFTVHSPQGTTVEYNRVCHRRIINSSGQPIVDNDISFYCKNFAPKESRQSSNHTSLNATAIEVRGNKSNRLKFIHITKTGGSAIEAAAASQANLGACHYRLSMKHADFSHLFMDKSSRASIPLNKKQRNGVLCPCKSLTPHYDQRPVPESLSPSASIACTA